MSKTQAAALRRELNADCTHLVSALDAAELARLTDAVRAAKQAQKRALNEAINEGMSFVPALLRIPLKRILFP